MAAPLRYLQETSGRERLPNQFLAPLPKPTRIVRIKRISKSAISNTGTFSNGRNTAIFTVLSTDLLRRGRDGSPYSGGRTLWDRLVDQVGSAHLLHVIQQGLEHALFGIPPKFRGDGAWHQRTGTDTAMLMAPVKFHREQHVGSLGPAVGNPGVIGSPFEVRIIDINVTQAVSRRPASTQVNRLPPRCPLSTRSGHSPYPR